MQKCSWRFDVQLYSALPWTACRCLWAAGIKSTRQEETSWMRWSAVTSGFPSSSIWYIPMFQVSTFNSLAVGGSSTKAVAPMHLSDFFVRTIPVKRTRWRSSENETLMRFPTNRVLPLLGTKSNIRLVLNEWIWDCVSRRYLPVMKPAQTGRSNEHWSDGDAPFVPYNGRFEYFGRMPLGGHPCVPGKSKSACVHGVFGRPCLPVMTSTACTAGPPVGGGVLSIHTTWKSCRKLFCLASTNIFSGVSKL